MAGLLDTAAREVPDKLALSDGRDALTYAALHDRVDRLARHLCARGVGRGDRVAIGTGKEVATVVAILAAWRAGAVAVPLDRSAPAARIAFLLEDLEPAAIIAPARLLGDVFRRAGVPALALEELAGVPDEVADVGDARPEDVASIFYTSGSSGTPKGVQITHGNLAWFCRVHGRRMELTRDAVSMNTAPFHFDVTIMDTFLPLGVGGTVHLTPAIPMPPLMWRLLEEKRVTHLVIVASVLGLLTGDGAELATRDLSALRMILFGAEVCDVRVVHAWLDAVPGLRMLNNYGPTETTVVCLTHEVGERRIAPGEHYPIGAPHEGTEAWLATDTGARAALGEPGELLLAGPQVMKGYWRRPEEDARVLVHRDGRRFYRTGDLCRQDPDGAFVYLGRVDDEVKIGGYRIHLQEVRRTLLAHPRVQEAVAAAVTAPSGRRHLGAVLRVAGPVARDELRALRAYVRAHLPAYMVPSYLAVTEDALPRLPSGKIDGRAAQALLERAARTEGEELFRVRGTAIAPLPTEVG